MPKKFTQKEVIEKFTKAHGNKYDYSFVEYIGSKTRVKIICKKHGIFYQTPEQHFVGQKCIKCGYEERSMPTKKTKKQFIENAIKTHGDKYNYSKVEYINNKTKVKIICKKHGEFLQRPDKHTFGEGCLECGGKRTLTKEEFIDRSNKEHNYKFDYSKTIYRHNKKKVTIICPKHGEFIQTPKCHMRGAGCCYCLESKGERKIQKFLINKDIKHVREYTFINCKNINKLPFDFYILNKKTLIEYDGEQHFKPVKFGNISNKRAKIQLIKTQKNDQIKNNYCKENDIKLIRIPYTEFDNIEKILSNEVLI